MKLGHVTLGIMAKYWQPTAVKTRLGVSIGMANAARLHQLFCAHLVRSLAGAAERQQLVIAPAERHSDFVGWLAAIGLDSQWELEQQVDGDLGVRMRHWFERCLDGEPLGASRCPARVLIGADCPLVSPAIINDAWQQLQQHDVVLGPAEDGGYYLIGLRGWSTRYEGLFQGIHWSSESVFEQTIQHAEKAGLRVATLPIQSDVDTEDDLLRLRQTLDHSTDRMLQDLAEQIERILAGGE